MSKQPSIGIIGVGNMGLGMARALLKEGFTVHGCDPAPQAAAQASAAGVLMHNTAVQLAAQAEVLLVSVVNANQIDGLLPTLLPALTAAHTVLLMSTIAPADAARFVHSILATGAAAIDAPMSGGPERAAMGQLSLMLAGAESAISGVQAVLDAIAKRMFVISTQPGDAAKAKLLNNLLAGIHLIAGAQVLRLAGELGLDEAQFLALSQASSGQSWIAGDRLTRLLAGDETPRSYMHILTKDVTLANAMLSANDLQCDMGLLAQAGFDQAISHGLALADDSAVYGII